MANHSPEKDNFVARKTFETAVAGGEPDVPPRGTRQDVIDSAPRNEAVRDEEGKTLSDDQRDKREQERKKEAEAQKAEAQKEQEQRAEAQRQATEARGNEARGNGDGKKKS